MQSAAFPQDESDRLAALRRLQVLDTAPEAAFDRVVELARDVLRVPMSAVSLVDQDRQWFKAFCGFCTNETPRRIAFCAHTILRNDVFIVPDAAADERFADNPLVTGVNRVRFYAAAPIRTPEGQPVGALCIADHTPREFSDLEISILRRLADTAAEALHTRVASIEAEAASRATAAFVAGMGHDLRTPLTAMLGFADLLADDGLDAAQRREYSETIRRSGHRLLGVINDLLDYARIEAGGMTVDDRAFPVADLVADVQRDVEPLALEKGLSFAVEVDGRSPTTVCSDPARVRQVLSTLASSAVRLTDRGSVTLRVRPAGRPDRVRFDVADTNTGLTPDQAAWVLRQDGPGGASARRLAGMTLALRVARQLTTMLGGEIEATSAAGVGSVVSVTLPTFRAGVGVIGEGLAGVEPAGSGRPLEGARVLVVDDEVDAQRLLSMQLRRAGAVVAVAASGESAVEVMSGSAGWPGEACGQPRFDLVVLAVRLSVEDGVETGRVLRELSPGTPIVAVTSVATEEEARRCAELGCVAYLAKPVPRGVLVNTVRGLLSRREAELAA